MCDINKYKLEINQKYKNKQISSVQGENKFKVFEGN